MLLYKILTESEQTFGLFLKKKKNKKFLKAVLAVLIAAVAFVGNNVDIFSLCHMSPRAQARFIKSHSEVAENTKQIPAIIVWQRTDTFCLSDFKCVSERGRNTVFILVSTLTRFCCTNSAAMKAFCKSTLLKPSFLTTS